MNANWRYIHATPMLTVLILMAASTVHVWLDLKAMDSTVQVGIQKMHFTFVHLVDICYTC